MAKKKVDTRPKQAWSSLNGQWKTVHGATDRLPVGIYEFQYTHAGIALAETTVMSDRLIELPDTTSDGVIKGIKKFWDMEEKYRQHQLLYKRGILMYGPPGSGKTATLVKLARFANENDGIVCSVHNIDWAITGLRMLREAEPNRRVLCVFEDLEIFISNQESSLLSFLDGEAQVDNVVSIATTNYVDKLPPRIVNRPSRFDECVSISMPTEEARRIYLTALAPELSSEDVETWVSDTANLSIAHLKEMVIAVHILGQNYNTVLARLKEIEFVTEEKGIDEDEINELQSGE